MNELTIFGILKTAYETTTQDNNRFLAALLSLPWDDAFQADGEHYFGKGAFLFITPSLDPFIMSGKPSAVVPDGSMVEL